VQKLAGKSVVIMVCYTVLNIECSFRHEMNDECWEKVGKNLEKIVGMAEEWLYNRV
jgi:hypothetical protein